VVAPRKRNGHIMEVDSLVEKPPVSEAPSRYAIMGRYILTPEIFGLLEKQAPGAGGEIQLTDAINQLAQLKTVLACEFDGKRFDTGNKLNLIKATIEMALERPDLKDDLTDYLQALTNQLLVK
jgi:UTP--glucose-1-phosphate uridylyltransferase